MTEGGGEELSEMDIENQIEENDNQAKRYKLTYAKLSELESETVMNIIIKSEAFKNFSKNINGNNAKGIENIIHDFNVDIDSYILKNELNISYNTKITVNVLEQETTIVFQIVFEDAEAKNETDKSLEILIKSKSKFAIKFKERVNKEQVIKKEIEKFPEPIKLYIEALVEENKKHAAGIKELKEAVNSLNQIKLLHEHELRRLRAPPRFNTHQIDRLGNITMKRTQEIVNTWPPIQPPTKQRATTNEILNNTWPQNTAQNGSENIP